MTKNKKVLILLKAMGDETRLGIVLFLTSGEKCVCQIYQRLKLPQNLISHHLGILRKSQLIKARKEGKWVYYSISNKNIKSLSSYLETILRQRE